MFMVNLDTESYYSQLGVEPTATAAEIRRARVRRVQELRERRRCEATRHDELLEQERQVNAIGEVLSRPANREKYDRENAHLRFFTPRNCAAPMFVEAGDRLDVIVRAVSAHLRRAGTPLPPLTDLERDDFPDDLTPLPLLDGHGRHE